MFKHNSAFCEDDRHLKNISNDGILKYCLLISFNDMNREKLRVKRQKGCTSRWFFVLTEAKMEAGRDRAVKNACVLIPAIL